LLRESDFDMHQSNVTCTLCEAQKQTTAQHNGA